MIDNENSTSAVYVCSYVLIMILTSPQYEKAYDAMEVVVSTITFAQPQQEVQLQ